MDEASKQTVYFYRNHPISKEIIFEKTGIKAGGKTEPEELWAHDQDHFGGTTATDELAREAAIAEGVQVVDFCSGLGGTLRYLAHRYGAIVTGIELTPERAAGAKELNALVGLSEKTRVIQANVMEVPIDNDIADVVISQEAFCHVPDLSRALSEAFRILRKGGRLALTDWIANRPLDCADAKLMWEGMAIQPLQSIDSYCHLVKNAGFQVQSMRNLTREWGPILRCRLIMYQKLKKEAEERGTPSGYDAFYRSYVRFVELIDKEHLGGIRLVAVK